MRVVTALAILVCGPIVGILIAIVLSGFALPPDPNFASNGGHVAPSDGFLVLGFIFVSLISVPLSILGSGMVFFYRRGPKLFLRTVNACIGDTLTVMKLARLPFCLTGAQGVLSGLA
jgi:hypothetical protein